MKNLKIITISATFAGMLKAAWLQSLQIYLLCAVAFLIPFPYIFSSVAIFCFTIAWLLSCNLKSTFHHLKSRKLLWLWIIYFLLHAISYFYSHNKGQSLFDLQTKLSFIVLPVLIGAGISIDNKQLEKIFLFFVLGISLTAIICIVKATVTYIATGDKQCFFYHQLVSGFDANAVYQAWYALFALSALLFFKWEHFFRRKVYVKYLLMALQVIFFLLLSARTLTTLFLILIFLRLRTLYLSRKVPTTVIVIFIALAVAAIGTLYFTNNPIKRRFADLTKRNISESFKSEYNDTDTRFNNLTVRLLLWRVGVDNVNEHHLWWHGAGNGDWVSLQNDKLAAIGITRKDQGNLYNVNLHNMYLQSLLMLGIPGMLCFICIIFSPFFFLKYIKHRYVFLVFHIISAVFFFQEAAFQTQAGIIFYTFFSQIYWNVAYTQKHNSIAQTKAS